MTTNTVIDYAKIASQLEQMNSRDDGEKLINSFRKIDLQNLAIQLEMPVVTSCTKAKLLNHIVEFTIGYRLDSAAIRNS